MSRSRTINVLVSDLNVSFTSLRLLA